MFLKILKNLFLIILILLFIVSGVLLQTSLVLNNTLFSNGYFDNSFDKNKMSDNILELTNYVVNNIDVLYSGSIEEQDNSKPAEISPQTRNFIDLSKKMLKDNIDMKWIQTEIPKAVKGVNGYFLSGSGELPSINIKPVKDFYVEIMAQSVIEHSGSNALMQVDKTVVASKNIIGKYSNDGKINDQVIDEMIKLEQFKAMNLSREAMVRIAQKMASTNNIKAVDMLKYSVTEMIKDKIDYYQIKDDLDLNLLFETKFGNKDNPVSGIANLISTIKLRELFMVFWLFILLFLIIAVTVYNTKRILRWTGVGMFVSGLIVITSYSFTGLVDSKISTNFIGLSEKAKGLDIMFVQKWILSYVNGVWKYVLIQALIFVLIGILLIAVSFLRHRFINNTAKYGNTQPLTNSSEKKKALPMLMRIAVVTILLIAIPVSTVININQIRMSVEQYNKTKLIVTRSALDTNRALGTVLNAQKLMDMMQAEKSGTEI